MTIRMDTLQAAEVITLEGVGKKYPFHLSHGAVALETGSRHDLWALEDVSLEVLQGETVGIIGRNGAGKTTLLNIIAGTITPSAGKVMVQGRAIGLFNLGVGFQDELTGRENIFLNGSILGATTSQIEARLAAIVDFSELGEFIGMPLGSYSQGMRLRLGFSIIANLEFDILILDEVLAVGDVLFQQKCYERLADFKRAGKTLVITTQSMELIERLCEKAALLDHGRILCLSDTAECIGRYRTLLGTEKFFVGPASRQAPLVEQTKKWADDSAHWGNALGTKEVEIETVEFSNRLGIRTAAIQSGDFLRVRVTFTAKNIIKDPHFGVAIFREDGAYCYGPNTSFDNEEVTEIVPGKGWFELVYSHVMLAPGNYKVSVAVMDKEECLPYAYYCGMYSLEVSGENPDKALTALACTVQSKNSRAHLFRRMAGKPLCPQLALLADKWGTANDADGVSVRTVRFLNSRREEEEKIFTGSPLEIEVCAQGIVGSKDAYAAWLGIYREDRILCQTVAGTVNDNVFFIVFPSFSFLPGKYFVSLGIFEKQHQRFICLRHGMYPVSVVFDRPDHGTVYLRHRWKWSRPR